MTARNKRRNPNSDYHMAEVLYQRLGGSWYAFAEVEGEMFVSKVDRQTIEQKLKEENHKAFDQFLDEAMDMVNGKPAPEAA